MVQKSAKEELDIAQRYADICSTCAKVKVGSLILTKSDIPIFGCNHGMWTCIVNGCRRKVLYGENSKIHRLPSDCDAIHSEVDAICKAAKMGVKLDDAVIYVTRYPCEACARAIAASGIKTVIYGRGESISEYTKQILEEAGVKVEKIDSWMREDNNE